MPTCEWLSQPLGGSCAAPGPGDGVHTESGEPALALPPQGGKSGQEGRPHSPKGSAPTAGAARSSRDGVNQGCDGTFFQAQVRQNSRRHSQKCLARDW